MENLPKTKDLPSIEKAMKDLEEYECTYQASAEKWKKISNEVENLKVQKQLLKVDIEEQKRIIKYYTDLHIDMDLKTQGVLISHNKAKLAESSSREKIKQTEAKAVEDKIPLTTCDVQIHQGARLETSKEDLLLQKEKLEQIVVDNNKQMEELLNKFKL